MLKTESYKKNSNFFLLDNIAEQRIKMYSFILNDLISITTIISRVVKYAKNKISYLKKLLKFKNCTAI